jgi:hypothetical protein
MSTHAQCSTPTQARCEAHSGKKKEIFFPLNVKMGKGAPLGEIIYRVGVLEGH